MIAEATFRELESAGLARIRCEPEQEQHDLSYVDTWTFEEEEAGPEAAKRGILEAIERDGLWVYIAEYREHETLSWQVVYMIGDCIGELDAPYAEDARRAVTDAHKEAKRRAWFAQGARCGHAEARCGSHPETVYIDAVTAAEVNVPNGKPPALRAWRAGYIMGAGLGLDGRGLPLEYIHATLPCPDYVPEAK